MLPITWNATRTAYSPATEEHTVDFRGKWVNWLDIGLGGQWRAIDINFNNDGDDWIADNGPWAVQAPRLATGRIITANQQAWNVHVSTTAIGDAPTMEISHPSASPVEGLLLPGREWQVLYPDAFGDGISLAVSQWQARGVRSEHLIVFSSVPPGDSEYVDVTAEIRTNGRIPGWDGGLTDISSGASVILPTDERLGFTMRPAVGWYYDAEGVLQVQSIPVLVQRMVDHVLLTKRVPRTLIEAAVNARPGGELRVDQTSTFYPNADPETTCFDGHCQRVGGVENWATIRAGNGTAVDDTVDSDSFIRVTARNTTNDWQLVRRGLFLFDTSSLGSGASVSSATLSLYAAGKTNGFSGGSPKANIYQATTSSNTAATASDFQACGTTAFSTGVAYSSWPAGAYQSFALNASGLANISPTGITKFSGREETYDAGGTTYPWTSNATMEFYVNYAESTGTTTDPKLEVTYTSGDESSSSSSKSLSSASSLSSISSLSSVSSQSASSDSSASYESSASSGSSTSASSASSMSSASSLSSTSASSVSSASSTSASSASSGSSASSQSSSSSSSLSSQSSQSSASSQSQVSSTSSSLSSASSLSSGSSDSSASSLSSASSSSLSSASSLSSTSQSSGSSASSASSGSSSSLSSASSGSSASSDSSASSLSSSSASSASSSSASSLSSSSVSASSSSSSDSGASSSSSVLNQPRFPGAATASHGRTVTASVRIGSATIRTKRSSDL